jgi:hypothetical protein
MSIGPREGEMGGCVIGLWAQKRAFISGNNCED